jgi:hypothetical protein
MFQPPLLQSILKHLDLELPPLNDLPLLLSDLPLLLSDLPLLLNHLPLLLNHQLHVLPSTARNMGKFIIRLALENAKRRSVRQKSVVGELAKGFHQPISAHDTQSKTSRNLAYAEVSSARLSSVAWEFVQPVKAAFAHKIDSLWKLSQRCVQQHNVRLMSVVRANVPPRLAALASFYVWGSTS